MDILDFIILIIIFVVANIGFNIYRKKNRNSI